MVKLSGLCEVFAELSLYFRLCQVTMRGMRARHTQTLLLKEDLEMS